MYTPSIYTSPFSQTTSQTTRPRSGALGLLPQKSFQDLTALDSTDPAILLSTYDQKDLEKMKVELEKAQQALREYLKDLRKKEIDVAIQSTLHDIDEGLKCDGVAWWDRTNQQQTKHILQKTDELLEAIAQELKRRP